MRTDGQQQYIWTFITFHKYLRGFKTFAFLTLCHILTLIEDPNINVFWMGFVSIFNILRVKFVTNIIKRIFTEFSFEMLEPSQVFEKT